MAASKVKKYGSGEYWGLTSDFDPDWELTESQMKLRDDLIEQCRLKIRPHAIHVDQTYEYPRESLKVLASLGILGLIIPKEFGGLGESHRCAVMITETIARYGCPSTAMVYTMHVGAVACLLFRYHNNPRIKDLLKRIDKECLVGTLSYSDPATGGHYWFPLSSKARYSGDDIKLLKYGSWATSAGCADWYCVQTVSPDFDRDYSNLSCFLIYNDEVRANTDDWSALGMHGNQSGPLVVEGTFSKDRLIGPIGDGASSNDEIVDPFFLMLSSAVWNGISLACLDLGKKHVTRKAHADVGMRVCDYPTIQDYFGDCVCETNINRCALFFIAKGLDIETSGNDWSRHSDLTFMPRFRYLHWMWKIKYMTAKNVTYVSDKMLHACGGSAYKTDLGLERLLRDAKAAWVMGPSNEVLRQFVGNTSLMGLDVIDYWDQKVNERKIHHELGKMKLEQKKKLAEYLAREVEMEEKKFNPNHPKQDTDFENPFNSKEPQFSTKPLVGTDGATHGAGLNPNTWTTLKLLERSNVTDKMASFVFNLPNKTDFTGLLPGQYVQVQAMIDGKIHSRYFSPVSRPDDFGKIEIVIRFESSGIISNFFRALKPGDVLDFKGPCGGFEYIPNTLKKLTLVASGGGITPGLQLIRSILSDKNDSTHITLIYYSASYDEILYREEIDQYAASNPRFDVAHTLGEITENWEGYEGFIDTNMLERHVDRTIAPAHHKIVMCGSPLMVVSCLYSLRSLAVSSEQIFIYGQFGAEQLRAVYGPNVKLSCHRSDNVLD